MSAAVEIALLRRQEEFLDRENTRLGRMQNELLLAHPGDLRLCPWLPAGTWARLPWDWHISLEVRVTPQLGIPLHDLKGSIGVSLSVAEAILGGRG